MTVFETPLPQLAKAPLIALLAVVVLAPAWKLTQVLAFQPLPTAGAAGMVTVRANEEPDNDNEHMGLEPVLSFQTTSPCSSRQCWGRMRPWLGDFEHHTGQCLVSGEDTPPFNAATTQAAMKTVGGHPPGDRPAQPDLAGLAGVAEAQTPTISFYFCRRRRTFILSLRRPMRQRTLHITRRKLK